MRSNLLVGALVAASLLAPAPSAGADPGHHVDLSRPSAGSTNVAGAVHLGPADNRSASADTKLRTGIAVYPLELTEPADTFTADVEATVPADTELAIDVRGRLPDRQWTEWTEIRPEAPAVLAAPTRDVEVRAVLSALPGASPSLRALTVKPSTSARTPSTPVAGPGGTYKVFATREGLVGGTTANGHRIVHRDHFVALPSRRGLSARWGGEYSVRVCAANGRCEWAPVWDVGPWNTRDDYWNPGHVRQEWRNLPQGRPQSQAAYQDGYNGGRDQFGRRVGNPAAIDLADGTFWDGLRLSDNSWVTVTYQWSGSGPLGYVRTRGDTLNARRAPRVGAPIDGLAANRAQVRIECKISGQSVTGTQGTTSVWYRLAPNKFVSAAFVSGGRAAPRC